jgi:protease I
MASLEGKKVAVLATHGFEQSELEKPVAALREAGATVHVVSLEAGEIKGWENKDWGPAVPVDVTLDQALVAQYDALMLPGGQMNPDLLRANPHAVAFVRDFWTANKPIGAICHAPWLLVEAGIADGLRMTSYKSIATDVKNAGAVWEDSEVVTDQGVVTSRKPDDLPAFCAKLIEEIAEGYHDREAA